MQLHYLKSFRRMDPGQAILAGLAILGGGLGPADAQTKVFASVTELTLPVGQGAQEPSLFAMDDGRVLMSWIEKAGKVGTVKTAIGDASGWSGPVTVAQSEAVVVNWADFPSVAAFPDGTLATQWLVENGPSAYEYDVNISLSSDTGRTWGDVIVPHRDRSRRQHGFATILPVAQDGLITVWLDGRAYDVDAMGAAQDAFGNAMQLRATTITPDGRQSDDILLDARTCTCCQTSGAVTGDGDILVVYRDRTAAEIRDISLVRRVDGVWSKPATIYADGWEIDGCPINGPAIDARGDNAVVAWFTGAQDKARVNLAFSDNSGARFAPAIRISKGEAAGRVDVTQLDDGSALVTWVEWTELGEVLLVCRAFPETGCDGRQVIALNTRDDSLNFPSMVRSGDNIYIAWTQPLRGRTKGRGLNVTVRMVLARL